MSLENPKKSTVEWNTDHAHDVWIISGKDNADSGKNRSFVEKEIKLTLTKAPEYPGGLYVGDFDNKLDRQLTREEFRFIVKNIIACLRAHRITPRQTT